MELMQTNQYGLMAAACLHQIYSVDSSSQTPMRFSDTWNKLFGSLLFVNVGESNTNQWLSIKVKPLLGL
jgi:hypothetical protein